MDETMSGKEISLSDLMTILWRYRVAMVVSSLVAATVVVVSVCLLYVATPNQQSASLPFRAVFEGAEKGEYPNGLKFSPSDVISLSVLELVYQQNHLEKYITFQEFKGSLFVYEHNPALSLLDKQYQQKLSNTKLSPVERRVLESEYYEKRESLRDASYELKFLLTDGLFKLPESLVDKILNDVLVTWARVADEQKGILKYSIPMYSRNILSGDLLESQDYIVTIDIFNNKIEKIVENISIVEQLPGAYVARVSERLIGLAEVKTNILDTLQFKLEPLVGLVRSVGLSKKPALATLYLENQLFQLQLDKHEAQEKIQVLQNSLNFYQDKKQSLAIAGSTAATVKLPEGANSGQLATTYIPQFGDSFLDRVVEMSTQSNDAEYRQEIAGRIVEEGIRVAEIEKKSQYYTSLIKTMKSAAGGNAELDEISSLIMSRFEEIENDILVALDYMNSIYRLVSKNNLSPESELYVVTAPLSLDVHRSFVGGKVLLGGVLFIMLSTFFTVLGCFIHHGLKERRR